MNPDPGWGSAIKWGLVAMVPFVRHRAMSVRPAITAARALTLAGVIGPLIILGLLYSFGDAESTDSVRVAFLVGGAIVVGSAVVLWLRYRPPYQFGKERSNLVALGLSHFAIISAFGMVPALVGFVSFFLGGGLSFYVLGLGATVLLLLVPGPR